LTVILVTHDEAIAARGSRLLRMRDGSVTTDELYAAEGSAVPLQ
jgi:predicted ABC-type transport system involved in lysophospholipase L1 biosynthesis ATPase subunit